MTRNDAEICWNPFGASLKSPTAVLLKDLPGSNVDCWKVTQPYFDDVPIKNSNPHGGIGFPSRV
jgi:hypothetical protein